MASEAMGQILRSTERISSFAMCLISTKCWGHLYWR